MSSDPLYDEKKEFFDAKKDRKLASFSALAIKKANEAKAAMKKSDDMLDAIPFGQPILVGHHSEKSDRNYRARAVNLFGKGIKLQEISEHYAHKADLVVNNSAISSDDPDAIAKLEAKLVSMEKEKLEIKSRPHKSWELSNLSQNMRSVKKRIEHLKAVAKVPDDNKKINGVDIIIDKVENRVKLVFPGKPAPEIISKLKASGFHWSPFNKAWQRMISNAALYYAEEIAKEVKI